MSALEDLKEKPYEKLTAIDKCILLTMASTDSSQIDFLYLENLVKSAAAENALKDSSLKEYSEHLEYERKRNDRLISKIKLADNLAASLDTALKEWRLYSQSLVASDGEEYDIRLTNDLEGQAFQHCEKVLSDWNKLRGENTHVPNEG